MLEFFFEWREAGRGEVHAAAGVVFAVARRGADAQDFVDVQAAGEFAFEDAELVFDGAEGGDDFQRQAGMFSYSGLSKAQVDRLREEFAIYALGTGRICVAALNRGNLDYVAEAVAAVSR